MNSLFRNHCDLSFNRARFLISKNQHTRFQGFRSLFFVRIERTYRAQFTYFYDEINSNFRHIRKTPNLLFQCTHHDSNNCVDSTFEPKTGDQLSHIAAYLRNSTDSHSSSCYNCTMTLVNNCMQFLLDNFSSEELLPCFYYLKEYMSIFHHDLDTSSNFPLHNCSGDSLQILDSRFQCSALRHFLWGVKPQDMNFDNFELESEDFPNEISDDESLPSDYSDEDTNLLPETGFSKIFYVNLLRNCLTDVKSDACRTSFNSLLNIRATHISDTGDNIRKILHTQFHPRDHTRIMTKFHDALQLYTRINTHNAHRFAKCMFEPILPQIGNLNIPQHIDFTLQLPAFEMIATKFSEVAGRIGLHATKAALVLRICWFFYDIARGERLSIAILRMASSGFDTILAKLLIEQATGLFASLSDLSARFFASAKATLIPEIKSPNIIAELSAFLMKAFLGRDDPDVDARIKNADTHENAKLIRSCATIAEFYTNLFSSAFEFIKKLFMSEQDQLDSLEVNIPKVAKWIHEVDALDNGEDLLGIPDLARTDCSVRNKIFRLKQEADLWVDTLSKLHSNQPFWQIFMEKYRKFNRVYEIVRANGNYTSREAPFVFILQGKPGVGKSLMVNNLTRALYRVRGEKFDSAQDTFMRAPTSPYWDGYGSQKVLYYNDLFQTTDNTTNQSVAMEIISCAQVVPMPLNCARIEKKDNMFFSSEIVVADCNIFPTDSLLKAIITEPDALRRRFAFNIEVVLKESWSLNGKFNTSKATRPFEFDAYDFKVVNTATNSTTLCDWKELVAKLSLAWLDHRGVQKRNVTEDNCGIDEDFIKDFREVHLMPQMGEVPDFQSYTSDFEKNSIHELFDVTVSKNPDWREYFVGKAKNLYSKCYQKYQAFVSFLTIATLLTNIHLRVKSCSARFQLAARQAIDKSRSFVSRHKMLFALVSCVASVGLLVLYGSKLWKMVFGESKVEDESHYPGDAQRSFRRPVRNLTQIETLVNIPKEFRYLDHHHEGLPISGRVLHSHVCANPGCGAEFQHTHVKRSFEASKKYPHLCSPCRNAGCVLTEEVSRFGSAESAMIKLAKNQYNVTNLSNGRSLNGWFLKDTIFVMPNHFWDEYNENDEFLFTGVHRVFSVSGSELCIYRTDLSKDIRILLIPRQRVVSHIDISGFLQSAKGKIPSAATVFVPTNFDGQGLNLVRHMVNDLKTTSNLTWSSAAGEIANHVNNGLTYHSDTAAGDCGALLVILDSTKTPRIVGMHMAGSFGIGVAGHITKEAIDRLTVDLLPQFSSTPHPIMDQIDYEIPENLSLGTPLCSTDNIEILGTLPSSLVLRTTTNSRIIPSLLYDTFEPITAPAMLRKTGDIDPMRNGVVKMARYNVDMNTEILQLATQLVKRNLFRLPSEYISKPENLTRKESINGIVGDKYIKAVNMQTSPGWPYKLSCKSQGKTDLIHGEVPDLFPIPSFDSDLDQYEQSLLEGSPEDIYFFDCLKDERRPIIKAKNGNTRVFSVGPLNFTLMMRKYTASFQAHCMSNATECGSAVGINPHSPEWGMLYRRLCSKGPNFIAGDYGKWDKWVPFQLMMAVLSIVNDFYDDAGSPEAVARECLFRQAFGAKRIAGRVVYQTSGGMPSGTPGTSIFNSLANEILFAYVFETLRREHQPKMLLGHYYSLVGFTAYGDDHVLSVSDLIPWFNMITVSNVFKSMNIEYTSADKSTATFSENYVLANDLTYLKRKFHVVDDFFVLAPLERTVICESILWAKSKEDEKANMRATISSALTEITHHGKKEYTWLDEILAKQCRLNSLHMPSVGYKDILQRIRGEGILIDNGVSLCDPMQSLE